MNGAKEWPTEPAPMPAPKVVRELCDSLAAATRGNRSHANGEIRRVVTLGAKLLATGAIDAHGAALINGAAAEASEAILARTRGSPDPASAAGLAVDGHRRIHLFRSIDSPPDQSRSIEDEQFAALLEVLAGTGQE